MSFFSFTQSHAESSTPLEVQASLIGVEIPAYLEEQYEFFDRTMYRFIQKTSTLITMDDLRDIAVLVHDLALSKLLILQWQTYLLSGTGQLKTTVMGNISIWPLNVKKMLIYEKVVNVSDESQIDAAQCLMYTESYLQQLHSKVEKIQAQLNHHKSCFSDFTKKMNQAIEKYVRQYYMDEAELRIKKEMIIVEYNYRDRLLELEFENLQPDNQQLQLYREFYRAHCEYEKRRVDVDILKQQMYQEKFPDIFHSLRIPMPIEVDSIPDPLMRQALNNRYHRIVQQTKSEMMLIHVAVAEAKLHQCYEHLKSMQNNPSDEQRLTPEMTNVMQRRTKDFEERMRRLYNLEVKLFIKPPTLTQYSLINQK